MTQKEVVMDYYLDHEFESLQATQLSSILGISNSGLRRINAELLAEGSILVHPTPHQSHLTEYYTSQLIYLTNMKKQKRKMQIQIAQITRRNKAKLVK